MKRSKRIFVAVPVPKKCKKRIFQFIQSWKATWNFTKWVHQDDYHLTLQFLGDTTAEKEQQVIKQLSNIKTQRFSLTIDSFGTFGQPERPRILWLGVTGEIVWLHHLQKEISKKMAPLGFPIEKRPYHPHLTIARKYRKTDFSLQQLPAPSTDLSWTVDRFVLYETRLYEQPMYRIVREFSL